MGIDPEHLVFMINNGLKLDRPFSCTTAGICFLSVRPGYQWEEIDRSGLVVVAQMDLGFVI